MRSMYCTVWMRRNRFNFELTVYDSCCIVVITFTRSKFTSSNTNRNFFQSKEDRLRYVSSGPTGRSGIKDVSGSSSMSILLCIKSNWS